MFKGEISALASKKRSNQKTSDTLYHNLDYFSLTLFLEAWAEILENISLGDLKTPKGHFKIN